MFKKSSRSSKSSRPSRLSQTYWCDKNRTSDCAKCTRNPLRSKDRCNALCLSNNHRCRRKIWTDPKFRGPHKWCKQHTRMCKEYMKNYRVRCNDHLKKSERGLFKFLPDEIDYFYRRDRNNKYHPKHEKGFKKFYGYFIEGMTPKQREVWVTHLIWGQPGFYDPEFPDDYVNTKRSRNRFLNTLLEYAEGCVDRKLLSNRKCHLGEAYADEHERYTKALELATKAIRRAFESRYSLRIPKEDRGSRIYE